MEVKLVEETCCSQGCGIMFWIGAEYRQRLVSTKQSFYCPNGHSMSYQGESDTAKIARLTREKQWLETEKNVEIARLKKELAKKTKPKKK